MNKDLLAEIVRLRTYAAKKPDGTKETHEQTVERCIAMHVKKFPQFEINIREAFEFVKNKKVVPSMRSLQFSGQAIEKENIRQYNCSFLNITCFKDFADTLYLLACGSGVGYSVQDRHVSQLPEISLGSSNLMIIGDSKESWADSVLELLNNVQMSFDYSHIRPNGAPLSSGGTASGPEPLIECHSNMRKILFAARGRKLTSVEVSDLICHIAMCIVSGGVRRCLPFDSLIHTTRGMIPIDQVKVGDTVQTSKGYSKVTDVFEQGVQTTIKVVTDAGVLECTPNHKVAVIDGFNSYKWVAAGSLTEGDRLVYSNVSLQVDTKSKLPECTYTVSAHATTLKTLIVPELDAELSWLLGYLQGNGYVAVHEHGGGKRNGIVSAVIPLDAPERLSKLEKCMSRFGLSIVTKDGDGACKIVSVSSVMLADYLQKHLKIAKTSMAVPRYIFESKEDVRASFVCGLFDADGAANNRPVHISSVYPEYLSEIQKLCASLGIPSYVKLNRPAKGVWKDLYHLCFKSSGRHHLTRYLELYGTKRISEVTKGQRAYSYKSTELPEYAFPKKLNISVDNIGVDSLEFVPVKVLQVGSGRTVPTFDLEVADVHEFYCEGFLVHNSALINLFDADNEDMLTYKSGNWWENNPQRGKANVSAILHRQDMEFVSKFKNIMEKCYASNCGEPGISLTNDYDWGFNPCHEIALRSYSACNLTEVNVAAVYTQEDFLNAVVAATFIGTLQASYTNFNYVSDKFKKNCDEEALLGVSFTGQAENWGILNEDSLRLASIASKETNLRWAEHLGINPAARIGCVKPSGSTSAVLGTTSGIHAAHAPFYLRRVRIAKTDPISQYLTAEASGLIEQDVFDNYSNVVTVPVKKDGAIQRGEERAIDTLERMKHISENWIKSTHNYGSNTHNVSLTVNYKESEKSEVVEWMLRNSDSYSGISLLPFSGSTYTQAPFEEITEEVYNEWVKKVPTSLDLSKINYGDRLDERAGESACSGGSCEIR